MGHVETQILATTKILQVKIIFRFMIRSRFEHNRLHQRNLYEDDIRASRLHMYENCSSNFIERKNTRKTRNLVCE